MWVLADKVRCNQCMEIMYVSLNEDTCPICGEGGCLMDIEQNVEIPISKLIGHEHWRPPSLLG